MSPPPGRRARDARRLLRRQNLLQEVRPIGFRARHRSREIIFGENPLPGIARQLHRRKPHHIGAMR